MKIKKVASLCGQEGRFYLLDTQAGQWLGDGRAAYPMEGLPYMEMDNICAMFDIPEKKQGKLVMRQSNASDTINWEDTDPRERLLDDSMLHLRYEGRELLPLRTSAGITFIQEKYLTPLDNLEYLKLYERKTTEGYVYIAAKIGMMVQAIIIPVDCVSDDLIKQLEKVTDLCRVALWKKNRMQAKREQEGLGESQNMTFQADESTGEILEGGELENG